MKDSTIEEDLAEFDALLAMSEAEQLAYIEHEATCAEPTAEEIEAIEQRYGKV